MNPSAGSPLPNSQRSRTIRSPFRSQAERHFAGRFGLALFLISLGALFAATLIAFLVLRIQAGASWPTSLPAVPWLLWVSTVVLIVGSGTIQAAVTSALRDRQSLAIALVAITGLLGVLFIVLQAIAWMQWRDAVTMLWNEPGVPRVAAGGFYVLTGIHAVHVLGGLVAILVVLLMAVRAGVDKMSSSMIRGCASYWHFLDLVWIILLLTMVLAF